MQSGSPRPARTVKYNAGLSYLVPTNVNTRSDSSNNTINEAHRWVIEDQATNEPVGVISIHTIDLDTGDADIGYWIAPWGRRRGAAAYALNLVEQFALTLPTIKFLSAHIAETNAASRATASRAGFINMGSSAESCPDGNNQVPALTYVKHLTR